MLVCSPPYPAELFALASSSQQGIHLQHRYPQHYCMPPPGVCSPYPEHKRLARPRAGGSGHSSSPTFTAAGHRASGRAGHGLAGALLGQRLARAEGGRLA